ncbi:class I SAM-dependent methyltransferase [Mycobacterium sp. ACS4331]|uniref:class I SAM-dependent methyltransferase n=1 Tax=Mycobacterium sp. ACS4331 TaxID=1834121 RepID=UPI0008019792|nr:class I SAM-dependent methyltransferase [Mycobacterium sp. ACS4331]OBF26636.1 transferase [Mycobacterium sp. ACS4331]
MTGSPIDDFEALYRSEVPAPWDTHGPKENVIAWHESGLVHGDVLDIGCGLGDNAIFLAQQGHHVTGLDFAPTAIATAEQRARDAGIEVTFGVADATKLEGYAGAFDTVVDSGCYHCLDDEAKSSYARAVHHATRPGATLLLSAFSDANAEAGDWPRPMVSEQTLLRTLQDAGWHVAALDSVTMPIDEGLPAIMWWVRAHRGPVT